jgi:hypothetical protein
VIDFTMSAPVAHAVGAAALQPLCLLLVTRWRPISGRNALQFVLSFVMTVLLWCLWQAFSPAIAAGGEIAAAVMVLAAAGLLYLEIWGLMSRGYTLSMLLTLLDAGKPLDEAGIARSYRGGDGLSWIMRHRVDALVAAGILVRRGDLIVLTAFPGGALAFTYRVFVRLLGLRRTG